MSKIYTDPTTGDLTDDPSRGGIEVTIPTGYTPLVDRLVLVEGAAALPIEERIIIDQAHRLAQQVDADVAAELALVSLRAERAVLARLKVDQTKSAEYRAAATARDNALKAVEDAKVAKGRGKT